MLTTCTLLTWLSLTQVGADEVSLQAMQRRAQESRIHPADVDDRPVQLFAGPVFRYSDELRRIEDASMWLWTIKGRPLAAMKVEHYKPDVRTRPWLYCFASLSSSLVVAEWPGNPTFRASKPGVMWQELPERPAATRPARLIQLRDIARRFSGEILRLTTNEERNQMRLLPRPLYRYPENTDEVLDGALFGFTGTGTNPDLLLLVEMKTDSTCQYGFAGMTAEGLTVRLNDKVVWQLAHSGGKGQQFDTWTYFVPKD